MTSIASTKPLRHEHGFTLIEILVVIAMILIISAVTLPAVLPALDHRQVSEAARILQAEIVGARDRAIRANAPSGIRLMPDPSIPLSRITSTSNPSYGQIDTSQPLAYNRVVPLEQAPDYTDGSVLPQAYISPIYAKFNYPGAGGGKYALSNILAALECTYTTDSNNAIITNTPTSWFWNIRIGDKIQFNNSGSWYTVVGPMEKTPADGNSEMFVNIGTPGTLPPQNYIPKPDGTYLFFNPEFLFLVNGQDDNGNGQTDEGWDGIDNDGVNGVDDLGEWETETWAGSMANTALSPAFGSGGTNYIIRRRPVPASTARTVNLPSNVVIDITTGITNLATTGYAVATPSMERSRLPVNPYTGFVDVMLNSSGSVLPTSIYSSPASFGMANAFYHFWLAERSDVLPPSSTAKTAPYLPIPLPNGVSAAQASYAVLKGQYRLVTLFTRTGLLTTYENVPFDNPTHPANGSTYNVNLPFIQAQQSIVGGF